MLGNVFTKPLSILALKNTVDDDARLKSKKAPLAFQSDNFVGVEIECIVKCSNEYLKDKFIEAGLQSVVQLKEDSSIRDMEDNEQGVEIVALFKEKDAGNIIPRICEVLKAKRISARVNTTCGLHVHLDMRHRIVSECYKNLYYSQNIMLGMVSEDRRTNDRYCKANVTPDFDRQLREGKTLNSEGARYHVINAEAYRKYKTLEVRLHGGTVNATKILNWVNMLTTIVNYKGVGLVYPIKTMAKFVNTFKVSADLEQYINKRTAVFSNKSLTEEKYSA